MKYIAKKRFGQNFLTDQSVIASLIEAISPQANDLMVEIGPGLGALTKPLLQNLNLLHVVEVDRDIISWMQKEYANKSIEIHNADALSLIFQAWVATYGWLATCPTTFLRPFYFTCSIMFRIFATCILCCKKRWLSAWWQCLQHQHTGGFRLCCNTTLQWNI